MSFSAAGPSVSVIGNWVDINSPGMYTVSASGPSCTSVSQTVSILQNTVAPTSSVSPSTQSISCFSSPPVSFTGTATGPTTNIVHKWFGPLSPLPNGGPLKIDNTLNSVLTGTFSPGTYTLQTIDQSNGCSTTKTVSITSADAFPVFTASSSTSFSMGCFPLDQTTLSIINAQSTQTPATPLSYTFLPPGFSGTLAAPPYNLNSVQITSLSGTWTLIVNDNGNNCKTMLPVAVISDTQPPHPMAVLLTRTLTCNTPTIQAICSSSTQNASFEWLWPGMMIFPGMKVIQIGDPQYGPLTSTTSLFYANYTVIATNSVNACQTQSIIPIYQNFQPPLFIPKILPNPTVICGNNPVVASYDYTCNGCPLPFLPNPYWQGPAPQTPTLGPSTYTCFVPGIYSLTGTHAYNGCIATKTIEVLSNNIPFGLQGIAPTNSTSCNGTVHIISQVYEGYTVSASTGSLNGTTVTNLCYGWLKVCLTNTATNCTKCDSILINGATFLDEVQAGPSLLIYPNPAAGNVRISSSSSRRVALELRDVSGRMVLSAEMEKELDLDISTLSAGTYFISLREGDRRVYRKLLVSAP